MKEKDFDTLLRDQLNRLEEPYTPSAWAAFEQRLNSSLLEESPAAVDEVDKAVYHKLQQLEAPYQPAHWNMLAQKMEQIRRLRIRIWVSKTVELVVFFLLISHFQNNVAPYNPAPAPKLKYNGPVAGLNHETAPSARSSHHSTGAAPSLSAARGGQETSAAVASLLPEELLPIQDALPLMLPDQAGNADAAPITQQVLAAAMGPLALLSTLQLPFDWSAGRPELPDNARISHGVKPRAHRFYFASYVGSDRNRVAVDDQNERFPGYNAGMAIGYRKGKWGVEAGIAYARRQYVPGKKVEIYGGNLTNGYLGSYLTEVDADLVSVPVHVSRKVAGFGKTSVRAVAGATANMAVQKSYRYETVHYPGSAPPSTQGGNALSAQPQLQQVGRGVFENGRLNDNFYASADLGLRVEQQVNDRFTVFIEPVYRHSLSSSQGLGPRPARINTMSIQAGVMAGL